MRTDLTKTDKILRILATFVYLIPCIYCFYLGIQYYDKVLNILETYNQVFSVNHIYMWIADSLGIALAIATFYHISLTVKWFTGKSLISRITDSTMFY